MIEFFEETIEKFCDSLIVNGMSENTVRAYRSDLRKLFSQTAGVGFKGPASIFEKRVALFLNSERTVCSARTVQRYMSSIKTFCNWQGEVILKNYKAPKAAAPQPHPIPEGIDGVVAMIRSTRNPRHKALLTLQGLMGLRVDEAINCKPDDFDLDNMMLKVRGKGDKVRYVPITDTAWKYLKAAHKLASANKTTITRLSNSGARASVSRHGRRAKLSRHVASHDLRATYATAAYSKTKDIRAVQEALGHASPDTTLRYTKVAENALRAAMEVA